MAAFLSPLAKDMSAEFAEKNSRLGSPFSLALEFLRLRAIRCPGDELECEGQTAAGKDGHRSPES